MMIVMMTMMMVMMMRRRMKVAIMTIWILFTPSPTLNSFNIVMTLNVDDDDGDEQMIISFTKDAPQTPWKLYTIEMLHFRLKYSCLTIVRNFSRKIRYFFFAAVQLGAIGSNQGKWGFRHFLPIIFSLRFYRE